MVLRPAKNVLLARLRIAHVFTKAIADFFVFAHVAIQRRARPRLTSGIHLDLRHLREREKNLTLFSAASGKAPRAICIRVSPCYVF